MFDIMCLPTPEALPPVRSSAALQARPAGSAAAAGRHAGGAAPGRTLLPRGRGAMKVAAGTRAIAQARRRRCLP